MLTVFREWSAPTNIPDNRNLGSLLEQPSFWQHAANVLTCHAKAAPLSSDGLEFGFCLNRRPFPPLCMGAGANDYWVYIIWSPSFASYAVASSAILSSSPLQEGLVSVPGTTPNRSQSGSAHTPLSSSMLHSLQRGFTGKPARNGLSSGSLGEGGGGDLSHAAGARLGGCGALGR